MATSRSDGGRSWISRPPQRMRPSVAPSKPAIMRSVLVLPQPEEPSNPTISPSPTARSTWSTASTGARPRGRYTLVSFSRRRSAMMRASGRRGGETPPALPVEEMELLGRQLDPDPAMAAAELADLALRHRGQQLLALGSAQIEHAAHIERRHR